MTTSQAQQGKGFVRRALGAALAGVERAASAYDGLEARGAERARLVIDETARLSHEAMSASLQLAGQWRKIALEAARRGVEGATPRG